MPCNHLFHFYDDNTIFTKISQLKDLGNLTSVLSSLKGTSDLADTFNGLSKSMQQLVLQNGELNLEHLNLIKTNKIFKQSADGVWKTVSGLTKEEMEATIATTALASAERATTVALDLSTGAKIANGVATKGVITEESKSLLMKGGLITQKQAQTGATVNLTKAKIADAVATSKLTEAEGKQLITTFGLQGKIGGLGTAFKGLGISIKSATASMWTFLTTTPAGWATLAVGAIAALTAGIYAYNKSIDEAVDNAKEKLSETESELSSYIHIF